jgi:hypothetical protein
MSEQGFAQRSTSLRALVGLVCLAAAIFFWPQRAQAVPLAQTGPVRATTVGGLLEPENYHYLGLEPALRDGTVVLTLALEPADDMALRGLLNFLVLDEDGLRRVLAGADPFSLDMAASAPLQFDPIGNKYQAMFKASGRGEYTVLVYNDAGKTGGYKLTALNGVLLDDAGQVEVVTAAPAPAPPVGQTLTPTATMEAALTAAKASPLIVYQPGGTGNAAPTVNALRISGELDAAMNRHFLSVKPEDANIRVKLDMEFEPQGEETRGQVNFYVLNADGVRQLVHGARPEDVSFAVGFPEPFNPARNELVAQFRAPGKDEYTIIPYSIAAQPVEYIMNVAGGVLIDRYGQTNESQAALNEYLALNAATTTDQLAAEGIGETSPAVGATAGTAATLPAAAASAPAMALTIDGESGPRQVTLVSTSTDAGVDVWAPSGASEVTGQLPRPFTHNYYDLASNQRDGVVVVTLDYAPKNDNMLRGNINFWVVDEDGMRRIAAGARPEDHALASGAEVVYGPDKGKLQGSFHASGRGKYSVILFNTSTVPASYSLRTDGGVLLTPDTDNALVQALP